MTGDEIRAILERKGMSAAALAETIGLTSHDGRHIRMLMSGERTASGPIIRLLEMLDRGELPERYIAKSKPRGRPPKPKDDAGL